MKIVGPWIVTAEQLVDLGMFERDSAKRPSLAIDNVKGAKYRPTDAGRRVLTEGSAQ